MAQVQHDSDLAAARGKAFRSGWLIWAIGATLIVLSLLGSGVVIWNVHDQIIEEQRQAVRNLGVVLAEQTLRYVQVVDLVLQEVQSRVSTRRKRSAVSRLRPPSRSTVQTRTGQPAASTRRTRRSVPVHSVGM